MVWFRNYKFILTNNLDTNSNREELINLYHKYFILLNGYDRMDSFLEVINDKIDNYLDKDIYEYATNYKDAVKYVNSLNRKDSYLCIYKNNILIGLVRYKKNNRYIRIYEIICDNKLYDKVIKYFEKEMYTKKIYLEVPVNDIKLLLLSNKFGYTESSKDITNIKKYIVNKEL